MPITCLLDSKICRVFQIIGCKQSRDVNIFAFGDKYKIKKKKNMSYPGTGIVTHFILSVTFYKTHLACHHATVPRYYIYKYYIFKYS